MSSSVKALSLSVRRLALPHADAVGSFAIDKNHGSHYGWSVNQTDEDSADQAALEHCTAECTVLHHFEHTCAAYAADQADGSSVCGWSIGADSDDAQAKAVAKMQRPGRNLGRGPRLGLRQVDSGRWSETRKGAAQELPPRPPIHSRAAS